MSSIGSIAPPWPLVRTFTELLFMQRSPSALERSTVPYWASTCALGRESRVQTPLPQIFSKRFRRTPATFEECPIEGTSLRYITLFFKGTYSVIGFYEVTRMFLVRSMHFLR